MLLGSISIAGLTSLCWRLKIVAQPERGREENFCSYPSARELPGGLCFYPRVKSTTGEKSVEYPENEFKTLEGHNIVCDSDIVPVIGDPSQLIYSPFHLRVHVGYSSSPSRRYAAARSPRHARSASLPLHRLSETYLFLCALETSWTIVSDSPVETFNSSQSTQQQH